MDPRRRTLEAKFLLEERAELRAQRAAKPAPAAPARPTLREQAAAHRAGKGISPEERTARAAAYRASRQRSTESAARRAGQASHPEGEEFARRVYKASHTVGDEGRYAGTKVYISEAHAAYEKAHGKIPIDDFKRRLIAAHQAGHVEIGRADMVQYMPAAKVQASETSHLNATFHFIRSPKPGSSEGEAPHGRPGQLWRESVASKPAAASKPTLREQAAKAREAKGTRAERLTALGQKMQSKYVAAATKRNQIELDAQKMHEARMASERRSDRSDNPGERRSAMADAKLYQQRAYELRQKAGRFRRLVNRLESRSPAIGAAIRATKGAKLPKAK